MISITSQAKFRQRVIKYSNKNGGTKAADKFRISRNAIYEWKAKYDGHWKSLRDKSHRPKNHPSEHIEKEKAMILRHYARNKDDKIFIWDTLNKKGYICIYNGVVRALNKWVKDEEKAKVKARKLQLYKKAEYLGQKVQVDVKFVPNYCVSNGQKYY